MTVAGNLMDEVRVEKSADGATAGTSDVNGTAIDLSGYDGVMFMARIGTANTANFLKAQEGDTSSPTADIEGSKSEPQGNDEFAILDVHKPLKRYIRAVLERGVSTTSGDIYAVLYKGRKQAQDNTRSGENISVRLISPVAGTP